jgi:hypothetical protein
MRINVDPETQAGGFDYVADGLYTLRVIDIQEKEKQYPYLRWELELADSNVKGVKGQKPGHVFEITTLKSGNNAQFRLKQICEALGLTWGDFDTDDVKGMELQAYLTIKEYNGTFSNEVDKFVKKEA